MNCLTRVSAYSASIFSRTSYLLTKGSGLNTCFSPTWDKGYRCEAIRTVNLEFLITRYRTQCFSTKSATPGEKKTRSRKKSGVEKVVEMDQEKDAFFVVRKGDVIGVYKNLNDCQSQVGTSILDPPVSVYKGYSLPKNTEEYLVSRGLKDALYTIKTSDFKEDLFGSLTPCPVQVSSSTSSKDATKKRSQEVLGSETSGETSLEVKKKHIKVDNVEPQAASLDAGSCTIEFDGASKGNPGPAGAGVVLRAPDGTVICKLREGLGTATNNAAEYRAAILGLRYALLKGYTDVRVRGDSKLVCMQIEGLWKVKNENLSNLYKEAKALKDKFRSFKINHVLRNLNSDADGEANLAITLADGEVKEV
ncbi:hypothetical protein ACFE04_010575 [Oxalis oulophora]